MMKEYNINQTTLKILSLYRNDYNKTLHLREIARETQVDVKAVQLQLKKLENLNILSSTLKGRNKEHRLNLNNLTTKYYMAMAETYTTTSYITQNFLIKKITSKIGNQVEGIITLFGSYAKNQATKESDIDILIIGQKPNSNIMLEAEREVGRTISIKVSSKERFIKGLENRDQLVNEVVANHITIKGIDQFCSILWQHYARQQTIPEMVSRPE